MRNILIAGLVHETHTFLKEETTLSDFEDLIWLKGQEMVDYVTPFSFDLEGDFFEFGQGVFSHCILVNKIVIYCEDTYCFWNRSGSD